jgi:serine/threonine protein kinase
LIKDDPDSYIFNENTGDSLLRFYAKQIINALEILDDNNYVHFDIKPENLLMSINLIVRLTDFSLLKEVKETYIDFKIPGGTQGYITPEYYIDKRVETETARKQDYFALGSSLFLLKYGLQLLKYKKYDDGRMNADRIVDLLQQNINYLKSQVFTDRDFIYFIISLINYTPEERAFFQQIIRNKWLNKNADELDRIVMAFENDEEKLIIELQKNDFFLQKEENLKKRGKKKFSKSNKYCFKKKQNN